MADQDIPQEFPPDMPAADAQLEQQALLRMKREATGESLDFFAIARAKHGPGITTEIGGVSIGPATPCRFVAEISNNHNGSLELARRLVDAVIDAGADFVKFQAYTPSELVHLRGDGPAPQPWGSQGWTMRTLYEQAMTPFAWFPELFAMVRERGAVPFASVFGIESLNLLTELDAPALKIAKLDNHHRGLFYWASRAGKAVLVSSNEERVFHPDPRIQFLYCPGGYPCAREDVHLPDEFASVGYLGLSSHCLDPDLPVEAVERGARLIEMHVMLDEVPSALEANVSLTVSQFAAMVDRVRQHEATRASVDRILTTPETVDV